MSEMKPLRDTKWLAQRLGLSITTIERLRVSQPQALPPGVRIGAQYRYSESQVEAWLSDRQQQSSTSSGEVAP